MMAEVLIRPYFQLFFLFHQGLFKVHQGDALLPCIPLGRGVIHRALTHHQSKAKIINTFLSDITFSYYPEMS